MGQLGRDWPQADAERQGGQRRTKEMERRSRYVLIGRTRGGQSLR